MKRLIVLALSVFFWAHASAQTSGNYPTHPIKVVVPNEAGGTMDVLGRLVAAQLTVQSGISTFIDNRPGANALIGTIEVAKAAPDGYTVLNVSPSFVLNPLLAKVDYNPFTSFEPITVLGIGTGYVLAVPQNLPVNSVAELIAYANKSKEGITYSSPGIGNAIHIASEIFADKAKIKMLHVPYKSSNSALNALVGGHVDMMLLSPATVIPLAAGGKVKILGFTGSKRSKEFPNVPTMQEAGIPDLVIQGTWVAWFAPAKTPPEVINRLHDEVVKALRDPKVAQALTEGGFEPDGRSPADFRTFLHQESDRFARAITRAGIAGPQETK